MSEFKLLRAAARGGDKEAIERLYREYGPALKRVARRQIKELRLEMELEPDDIFDSMFRIICLDPSRLDDMEPWQVYAYLEQMTKHKAIDAHRRRAAKKRGKGTTEGHLDLDEVTDHEISVADDFELAEEIQLTSAKLSGTERQICKHRADKYSWGEIGELMGMSASAAQKRHERAVDRVSRELHA